MTTIPAVVPPLPRDHNWKRDIAPSAAFEWLAMGWHDFKQQPGLSLAYGALVFLISAAIVFGLFWFGKDYILFPAFAGFMVVGPLIAIGLYEKSRRLMAKKRITLSRMVFVKPASNGQVLFIGVLLCLLMLVWVRAAVIVYALFFGVTPFPGLNHVAEMLFTTPTGWAMLFVGTAVGGLFAAFAFAIGAVSIPMLLDRPVDALTAMGRSLALVWHNLPVMLMWGAIVSALFAACLLTGMLGLIIVYPLLGHGTWHAYRALWTEQD